MASPAELNLDYKPPDGYAVKQLGDQQQREQLSSSQKIQDLLVRLEEERCKIDAFKRELPLCMQLLNNAIEYYRQQQQLEPFQTNQGPRPVLEEFMPLKHESVEGGEKATGAPSEKASWMISAQLWSPQPGDVAKQQAAAGPQRDSDGQIFDVSLKQALDAKQRNGGCGAFLPFSKEKNKGVRATPRVLNPELALVSFSEKTAAEEEKKPSVEGENGGVKARKENGSDEAGEKHGKGGGSSANEGQEAAASTPPPTNRKARRCWSPDLHRRFVNALQILGGSQVATPKQIREMMKVDGLTNDEVKSHLQKYRLHTRRPAAPQQAAGMPAPHLVVLSGIWVPPEYATSAAAGPAIYGAHAAPAHYCTAAAPVPQDHFYAPMPKPLQQHHHLLPHPPSFHRGGEEYRAKPEGSPESEMRSGWERSTESIEEEKEREEQEQEEDDQVDEEEDAEEYEKATVVQVTAKTEDINSGGSGGAGGGVALKF